MNYGLDDVVANMETLMCEHCHAAKYDPESGCDDCPADFHPQAFKCAKHAAYERIMKMLQDVDEAIYDLDHEEDE